MAKYVISVGLFFGSVTENLSGQSLPPIQLDRPDQTESSFITPRKYIQLEHGITRERLNNQTITYFHPSTLWKYGLSEKTELRLITELVSVKNSSATVTGLLPLSIGFKTSLLEENGIIPKTSLIVHITPPAIGSNVFHARYTAPAFRFTMQHTLSPTLSLAYNAGVEWDGEMKAPSYLYTLATGKSLTEKLGYYAEVYGYFPRLDKAVHSVDTGFTYLLHNNCMMDFSVAFGLSDNAPENYVSIGFSYRFSTSKNSNFK